MTLPAGEEKDGIDRSCIICKFCKIVRDYKKFRCSHFQEQVDTFSRNIALFYNLCFYINNFCQIPICMHMILVYFFKTLQNISYVTYIMIDKYSNI